MVVDETRRHARAWNVGAPSCRNARARRPLVETRSPEITSESAPNFCCGKMASPLDPKAGRILLDLPLEDLKPSTGVTGKSSLALLQLPDGWTATDLENASVVAQPHQPAVLLTKDQSFSLHHVETSNVCILVPPARNADEKPPTKKATHLLRKGGSGASFLELRPRDAAPTQVRAVIPVWNPYDTSSTITGKTLIELAHTLQLAPAQVQACILEQIPQTVLIQDKYIRVAEEAWWDALQAVVATLCEVDNAADHDIAVDSLLQEARARATELYDNIEDVLRAAIMYLSQPKDGGKRRVHLRKVRRCVLDNICSTTFDITIHTHSLAHFKIYNYQVAVCVAKRLLVKQSQPWDCQLFVSRWMTQVPGTARVDETMLHGMAVKCLDEGGNDVFQYLPVDALPLQDPAAYFQTLFATKEAWTEAELTPYIQALEREHGAAPWLLRYCASVTVDGEVLYAAKK